MVSYIFGLISNVIDIVDEKQTNQQTNKQIDSSYARSVQDHLVLPP
jgi:hypothetical protein